MNERRSQLTATIQPCSRLWLTMLLDQAIPVVEHLGLRGVQALPVGLKIGVERVCGGRKSARVSYGIRE